MTQSPTRMSRPCPGCGEIFEPRKVGNRWTAACSTACSAKRTSVCGFCGEDYLYHSQRKYCSHTCAMRGTARARGAAITGPRPHLHSRIPRVCAWCSEKFEVISSDHARGRGRFCSTNCFHTSLRADSGAYVSTRAADVRRYFSLKLKGETHCRNCGSLAVHLHHAIPRSMSLMARTDLRNGLPLCPACHHGWHYRDVTLHRDVFTDEEWTYLHGVTDTGRVIAAWLEDRYPAKTGPDGSFAPISMAVVVA